MTFETLNFLSKSLIAPAQLPLPSAGNSSTDPDRAVYSLLPPQPRFEFEYRELTSRSRRASFAPPFPTFACQIIQRSNFLLTQAEPRNNRGGSAGTEAKSPFDVASTRCVMNKNSEIKRAMHLAQAHYKLLIIIGPRRIPRFIIMSCVTRGSSSTWKKNPTDA